MCFFRASGPDGDTDPDLLALPLALALTLGLRLGLIDFDRDEDRLDERLPLRLALALPESEPDALPDLDPETLWLRLLDREVLVLSDRDGLMLALPETDGDDE